MRPGVAKLQAVALSSGGQQGVRGRGMRKHLPSFVFPHPPLFFLKLLPGASQPACLLVSRRHANLLTGWQLCGTPRRTARFNRNRYLTTKGTDSAYGLAAKRQFRPQNANAEATWCPCLSSAMPAAIGVASVAER